MRGRIPPLLPVLVVGRPVKLIGARLGLHVHHGARRVPVGRIERRRLQTEFFNRVGRRHESYPAVAAGNGRAIDHVFVLTDAAGGVEFRRAADIEGAPVLRYSCPLHAGREGHQGKRVEIVERQFHNLPPIEQPPARGRYRVENRRLCRNLDLLADLSQGEFDFQVGATRDTHRNAASHDPLEARRFHSDRIGPRIQQRDIEVAALPGLRPSFEIRLGIVNGHLCLRNGASLRINYAAGNRSARLLCPRLGRQQHKREDATRHSPGLHDSGSVGDECGFRTTSRIQVDDIVDG